MRQEPYSRRQNRPCVLQFRKWANGIVKDYTIKGWVIDAERLKNGGLSVPSVSISLLSKHKSIITI